MCVLTKHIRNYDIQIFELSVYIGSNLCISTMMNLDLTLDNEMMRGKNVLL